MQSKLLKAIRSIFIIYFVSVWTLFYTKGIQAQRAKAPLSTSRKTGKEKNKTTSNKPTAPTVFHDFTDCVGQLKKSVYLITRGRSVKINETQAIQWTTLGTGFIAAPYRLLTASHVMDDPTKGNDTLRHKTGDIYYLIKNDSDSFHWRIVQIELNKGLFLYPEYDLAVIYLDEEFYRVGDKYAPAKDDFITVETNFFPIGSSVGVLGYPLVSLEFEKFDITRPKVGDVLLRANAGVINTRYKTQDGTFVYDFTMMFNPGNSGGPVFDTKTGKVVSIVSGYKAIPIKEEERVLKEKAFIATLYSTYSFGRATATPAIIEILKTHNIIK